MANNHFKTKKIQVLTRVKNGHIPKGLVHGFCPKIEISRMGVSYGNYDEVLKRGKKWTFSRGVCPWILSKNRTCSFWRFSQKSYQKRSFFILWKEKNDFK